MHFQLKLNTFKRQWGSNGAMLRVAIAEASALSCGYKTASADCGGNPQILWGTPEMLPDQVRSSAGHGWPVGVLRQLTSNGRQSNVQFQWSRRQRHSHGKSLVRPLRKFFSLEFWFLPWRDSVNHSTSQEGKASLRPPWTDGGLLTSSEGVGGGGRNASNISPIELKRIHTYNRTISTDTTLSG